MSYLKYIIILIYLTGENAACTFNWDYFTVFQSLQSFKRTTLKLQVAGRNKITQGSNNEKKNTPSKQQNKQKPNSSKNFEVKATMSGSVIFFFLFLYFIETIISFQNRLILQKRNRKKFFHVFPQCSFPLFCPFFCKTC